jgi:hypothetical protein
LELGKLLSRKLDGGAHLEIESNLADGGVRGADVPLPQEPALAAVPATT